MVSPRKRSLLGELDRAPADRRSRIGLRAEGLGGGGLRGVVRVGAGAVEGLQRVLGGQGVGVVRQLADGLINTCLCVQRGAHVHAGVRAGPVKCAVLGVRGAGAERKTYNRRKKR